MSEEYFFNPEADPEFSSQAMHNMSQRGWAAADYGGDMALRVEFELAAVHDKFASEQQARPVYRDKEMIRITHSGGKEVVYREVRDKDKKRFAERYRLWKNTRENKVPGMPLEELPGLTASQIKSLQHQSIMIVEQLASVPDTDIPVLGMGGHELRERARQFFIRAKGAEPEKKMLLELQVMRDRIEILENENKALITKRGPGRPRKNDLQNEEERQEES